MEKIIILDKKEGETPLQALTRFRARNKKYRDVKMTYAGRLDPLVSGLLLILAGEAIKEKEKYLGLTKEYEFEVLFGFATDTHDILGKITGSGVLENIGVTDIKKQLRFFTGRFRQEYPLYASRNIKRARRGESAEPHWHEVEVKKLEFLGLKKITGEKLMRDIEKRINKVEGDFRQKDILNIWRKRLKDREAEKFIVGKFKVKCGSGMYVRRLAHDLGGKMGVPALAWRIKRTKIGKFAKMGEWAHKTS